MNHKFLHVLLAFLFIRTPCNKNPQINWDFFTFSCCFKVKQVLVFRIQILLVVSFPNVHVYLYFYMKTLLKLVYPLNMLVCWNYAKRDFYQFYIQNNVQTIIRI